MLHLVTNRNRDKCPELLSSMYRDRKSVFVDILGWPLAHRNGEERDAFDTADAHYLILQDPHSGGHIASLRLLATDRPHLLDTVFPTLCDGPVPRGPRVREITRLCLPFRRSQAERLAARNLMARAIIEHALAKGIESYTAVCNMEFAEQLLDAGWRCYMLGAPRTLLGARACALQIHIDPGTARMLKPQWRTCSWDDREIAAEVA